MRFRSTHYPSLTIWSSDNDRVLITFENGLAESDDPEVIKALERHPDVEVLEPHSAPTHGRERADISTEKATGSPSAGGSAGQSRSVSGVPATKKPGRTDVRD